MLPSSAPDFRPGPLRRREPPSSTPLTEGVPRASPGEPPCHRWKGRTRPPPGGTVLEAMARRMARCPFRRVVALIFACGCVSWLTPRFVLSRALTMEWGPLGWPGTRGPGPGGGDSLPSVLVVDRKPGAHAGSARKGLGAAQGLDRRGRGDWRYTVGDDECRNTVQGRAYLTDSEGTVCPREELDPDRPGCCLARPAPRPAALSPRGARAVQAEARRPPPADGPGAADFGQFSCWGCDVESSCCREYEFCVSCCMSPERDAARSDMRSRATHVAYRTAANAFEFCSFKCRTYSGSLVHENAYRGPLKQCFGPFKPPMASGMSINSDGTRRRELSNDTARSMASQQPQLDPFLGGKGSQFLRGA